jgi:hypothetical protein
VELEDATSKGWRVEVQIKETTDETQAVAKLLIDARSFAGTGAARRNPVDPSIPRIGEELAVSRALSDLAHRLMEEAGRLIETHGPEVPAP